MRAIAMASSMRVAAPARVGHALVAQPHGVEERPLTIDQRYASFHDYWESFLRGAGPACARAC